MQEASLQLENTHFKWLEFKSEALQIIAQCIIFRKLKCHVSKAHTFTVQSRGLILFCSAANRHLHGISHTPVVKLSHIGSWSETKIDGNDKSLYQFHLLNRPLFKIDELNSVFQKNHGTKFQLTKHFITAIEMLRHVVLYGSNLVVLELLHCYYCKRARFAHRNTIKILKQLTETHWHRLQCLVVVMGIYFSKSFLEKRFIGNNITLDHALHHLCVCNKQQNPKSSCKNVYG